MIELKGVSKSYGKASVLTDISLRIEPGEFVCITGPSGAGKSTLLHLLTGAESVDKGRIEIDGVDMRAIPSGALQLFRRRLGIVFQDYKLLLNRTVAENIAFPLEVCGMEDAEIQKRIGIALKRTDMTKYARNLPHSLSGGQKARAAIARAVVHDPLIVLADEPTGNVDPEQSVAVMELFQDIHDTGATVIIATHDSGLVDALQTRVIELKDGTIARDSVGGYQKKRTAKKEAQKKTGGKKRSVKVTAVSK